MSPPEITSRLVKEVLDPMKKEFVGKDEIIDLLGICLVGGENLFLFGPFDIRRLREGELLTNTEGMLPEASLVFLDELLNANSAILNSLLVALNERLFRRGKETRSLAALMFVGASNHLPEDDALQALFDRFLLRVHCDNVASELLP